MNPATLLSNRVERLSLQKQQIISELENLKDEAEDLRDRTNGIEFKLDGLMKKQKIFTKRVEQILYRVESKSLHLSEAEECMRTELEGLQKHIKVMSQKLIEVCKSIYRWRWTGNGGGFLGFAAVQYYSVVLVNNKIRLAH